jgi:formate C-acetyltransferase
MVYEAWVGFANRYAKLAEKMSQEETDKTRAKELEVIARICRRVPEYPARTFKEAIQAFWFTWIMMGSPTNSAGRFDQYMYPFYREDLENGRITPEEALELLENMKVKTQAFRSVRGSQSRAASSGGANWFNFTIGGVDKDGNDATNDLTYMMIEASRETMLPNHTISLRVHEGTPDLLMKKALELVKTGIGMPAFVSDPEYIKFFVNHGVTLEDARNYALSGCLDGNIPGKTRIVGCSFIGNMQLFDIFLHNVFSNLLIHFLSLEVY